MSVWEGPVLFWTCWVWGDFRTTQGRCSLGSMRSLSLLWRVYKEGSQGHGLQLLSFAVFGCLPCVYRTHSGYSGNPGSDLCTALFIKLATKPFAALPIQPDLQETCSSNIFSVATFKEDILLKSAPYWGVKSDAGIAWSHVFHVSKKWE